MIFLPIYTACYDELNTYAPGPVTSYNTQDELVTRDLTGIEITSATDAETNIKVFATADGQNYVDIAQSTTLETEQEEDPITGNQVIRITLI